MKRTISMLLAGTMIAGLAGGTASAADARVGVFPGDHVRVDMEHRRMIGRVLEVRDDVLVLLPPYEAESITPVPISWSEVRSLEMSRGKSSAAGSGFKAGAIVGTLAFTPIAIVASKDRTMMCEYDCSGGNRAARALGGIAIGTLTGAVIGTLIGAATRTEHWMPVRKPQVGLGLEPTRGGMGASVAVRF